MERKRSLTTYIMIGGALCLAAWAASAMPRLHHTPDVLPSPEPTAPKPDPKPPQVVQVPKQRPQIEVVFALDTTGSMSGLIEGAKRKIWAIANFIAQGNPKPDLRVGLVAYRDKGDEYVTRFYDLSGDLDQVFERLSKFEAAGGGDTPEHVAKALSDAVFRSTWTTDQRVLKQIYLVGDAPPHSDYRDGLDYRAIARKAQEMGIRINTIRCGHDRATQVVWNQISNLTSGAYASIDQSGGVVAVATPFDDKLAELNAKLVDTTIGYGRYRATISSKVSAAKAVPRAVAADRAGYWGATGAAVGGEGDLVRDFESGKAAPAAMPAAELPPEMAAMPAPRREAYVKGKLEERKRITDEINTMNKKRLDYLKGREKADAFDSEVRSAIKSQAESIGVAY